MSNKESLGKTLAVVLGVSLVCSVVVSAAAVALKPTQEINKQLDKQRNILEAAHMLQPGMSGKEVRELFAKQIDTRIIDIKTGDYVAPETLGLEKASDFDQRKAAKTPETNLKLSGDQDLASIKRRSNYAAVYLARNEQGEVTSVVLPMHGYGLWSMMYAFVAVQPDANTIVGLTYYDQGETPGLGGEITNPKWRALWEGKKLFDENGDIAIKVVKGVAPQGSAHEIDGLSGATLTSNGVQYTFDFWLSDMGFGPYLTKVRNGELNNG
ncbi:Na(+)-translocating NADH-quinone reductase subunit C [Gallaecimonas sp. GXIMD4217]|uniref:Na(+)-translocating NADH-quinone reductase subunit C n=1 Tax=Gallaecimonas sp. GXIMD4217 TaxID=3131927 RepID=UPI00311AD17C